MPGGDAAVAQADGAAPHGQVPAPVHGTRGRRTNADIKESFVIRIEVVNTTVDERSGNKNGKNWQIREQGAYAKEFYTIVKTTYVSS